jgi:glycosyltransferase involved in cell wall biosynthesis
MFKALCFSFLFMFYASHNAFGFEKKSSISSEPQAQKILSSNSTMKKTICLNMIVKDESPVIKRCLSSVKKFIDYWVIVDTGSTDGTQEIIQEFMNDLPGKLYERPWKNFGHNRNEALQLAKGCGDYVLFIDADEVFITPEGYRFPPLEEDGYLISVRTSESFEQQFPRWFLMNNHLDLFWQGVVHEQLNCSKAIPGKIFSEIVISAAAKDGHRSQDPQKYLKDAKVLEEALKQEPDNTTYVQYLAQCYFSAKEYTLSLKTYAKRAEMGGWEEEVFWAKYRIGVLQELMGMRDQIVKSYCDAYHYRPSRGEPLFRLAAYYYDEKNYLIAYALAKQGLTLQNPRERMSLDDWIYDYGFLYYSAVSAAKLGKTEEAVASLEKLLLFKNLPELFRKEAKKNLTQIKTDLFLQKARQ